VREVGRDTLDPVLYLLTSHDAEVQRAASAALGNLAVNGELGSWFNPRPELSMVSSREQTVDRFARRTRTSDPPDAQPERGGAVQRSRMRHQPCYSRQVERYHEGYIPLIHRRREQDADCEVRRSGAPHEVGEVQGHEGSEERDWRVAQHDSFR
jgi:hypothetical protein